MFRLPYNWVNSAGVGPYQLNPADWAKVGLYDTAVSHWDGPVTLFALPASWLWNAGSVTATSSETNFGGGAFQVVFSWFMINSPSV